MNKLYKDFIKLTDEKTQKIVSIAKKYEGLLTDKDFIGDYNKKLNSVFNNAQNLYKNDFIAVYSYKNCNGKIRFNYNSSVHNRTKDTADNIRRLGYHNYIIIQTPQKVFNRLDLNDNERALPGAPSNVALNILKQLNTEEGHFIFTTDAKTINKYLDTSCIKNWEDFDIRSTASQIAKAKKEKLSLADVKLFNDNTISLNEIADGQHLIVITKGLDCVNEKGEIVLDHYTIKNYFTASSLYSKYCELFGKEGKLLSYINYNNYKRLQNSVPDKLIPTWTSEIISNINGDDILNKFNSFRETRIVNNEGLFNCYVRYANGSINQLLKDGFIPTRKQQQFIDDVQNVTKITKNIDEKSFRKNRNALKELNKFIKNKADLSDISNYNDIDLKLNEKYPFNKFFNNYNNDDVEQMKFILTCVEQFANV